MRALPRTSLRHTRPERVQLLGMPHPEYLAVRAKVDAFTAETSERRQDDLACRSGCSACCRVELEVTDVEADALREAIAALPEDVRARLAERAEARAIGDPCVMLESERCVVYEARPLVCRTQGHALRYPSGTLPSDAVRAHGEASEVTWCPLNYRESGPTAADILDAERVDVLVALVNRRATPKRALARTSLVTLAKR